MERIYLDYAASTPVDPRVLKAMEPYFSKNFGNPSSLHFFGQGAIAAVDKGRETIARILGAHFREIIFVSSATEANNLALRGVIGNSKIENPEIITSVIEHESVLDTCRDLAKRGTLIHYLPVSGQGFLDLEKLKEVLSDKTVLVSIIYVSNEIGVVEPISEIGKIIKEFRLKKKSDYPLFHTDAAQATQFLNIKVDDLGVDLMTLSSQKIYGPKGMACLYLREAKNKELILPFITGGGQEFGLRSGTENVPAIVGFAKAAELIEENKAQEEGRIKALRDYFWGELRKAKPELELNGDPDKRLANNLNIYFPGHDTEELIVKLDLEGLAVSAGSACAGRNPEPSYVVSSLGLGEDRAASSLRITLGRPTTKREIDKALEMIIKILT